MTNHTLHEITDWSILSTFVFLMLSAVLMILHRPKPVLDRTIIWFTVAISLAVLRRGLAGADVATSAVNNVWLQAILWVHVDISSLAVLIALVHERGYTRLRVRS